MSDRKQPRDEPRLQDAYVSIRYWLGAMSLVSVASLSFLSIEQAQWTAVTDTAGFIDSPPLRYITALTTCYVVPILMYAVLKLAKPRGASLRRPFMIRCIRVVGLISMGAAVLSMGIVTKLIPDDAVQRLINQDDAVANFNRVFCHAWCRHADDKTVLIARGQCEPVESTVFDEILNVDVAAWCKQAIARQNYYELAADDNQIMSPFAGLKRQTRQRLLNTHTEKLQWLTLASTILSCWVVDHTRNLAKDLAAQKNE